MVNMRYILIFCFSLIFFLPSKGQATLQQKLNGAMVSFAINDAITGERITHYQSEVAITPASITKLITTASALEILGADYRFRTYIEYDGTIQDSILNGNLYIRGTGDPTLGSDFIGDRNFMQTWTEAVRRAGIAKVTGNIVADASAYDDEGFNPRWTWLDVANYYASGIYGISINDNTLYLSFQTDAVGTTPVLFKIKPENPNLIINNQLRASKIDYDSAYIYGAQLCNTRILRGAIPAYRKTFVVRGDIPNPPQLLAQQFKQALEENNITVSGHETAIFTVSTTSRKQLYIHTSPALKEMIKIVNFQSNNHYAEHIFKHIAFVKTGVGTNDSAKRIIKSFWEQKGIDVSSFMQQDGSGLSRENTFTVKFLNEILLYMNTKSRYSEDFLASLPQAGKDGTVRNILKNTRLQGCVQLKSGSMSHIQCYSGYINDGKHHYIFTVAVNNFSQPRSVVIKAIQQWLLDSVTTTE